MINDLYQMIRDGQFEGGDEAYRLRCLRQFTIHGFTVPAGAETQARFDVNCSVINSWVWEPGEFRNVSMHGTLIGLDGFPNISGPHYVTNGVITSCVIRAEQMIATRIDMNDVHTKKIKFFGAVGGENGLVIRDVRYPLSVRQYNTSYSEYREFLKEAGHE